MNAMAAASRITICFSILIHFFLISSAQNFGWDDQQLVDEQFDPQSLVNIILRNMTGQPLTLIPSE
jgi:hypothetical protein